MECCKEHHTLWRYGQDSEAGLVAVGSVRVPCTPARPSLLRPGPTAWVCGPRLCRSGPAAAAGEGRLCPWELAVAEVVTKEK